MAVFVNKIVARCAIIVGDPEAWANFGVTRCVHHVIFLAFKVEPAVRAGNTHSCELELRGALHSSEYRRLVARLFLRVPGHHCLDYIAPNEQPGPAGGDIPSKIRKYEETWYNQ